MKNFWDTLLKGVIAGAILGGAKAAVDALVTENKQEQTDKDEKEKDKEKSR